MSKLLLLFFSAFVLYLLVKGIGRKSAAKKTKEDEPQAGERMVACSHCGVNLPQGEALEDGGVHFCGEAHRRLGPR